MMAQREEELARQQPADKLGKMEVMQEQHEKVVAELRAPLQDYQTQLEQIVSCRDSWWSMCNMRLNNTKHAWSAIYDWRKQ